jgi:hypothetical protein
MSWAESTLGFSALFFWSNCSDRTPQLSFPHGLEHSSLRITKSFIPKLILLFIRMFRRDGNPEKAVQAGQLEIPDVQNDIE